MSDDDEGVLASRIIIERRLLEDGSDVVFTTLEDTGGDPLPLVEALGMLLRLAEDTAIREAMGELPD